MNRRSSALLAPAFAAITLTAGPAAAELIGIEPGFPMIFFNSQGVLSYDADIQFFEVDANPVALRFAPTDPPVTIVPTGDPPTEIMNIQILVGNTGVLIGGVPGDDLLVVGEADTDGDGNADYSGVLLTGEIIEFGYLNVGGVGGEAVGQFDTDVYDFRFALTGGSMAPLFGDNQIGVVVSSEMSNFDGNFAVDFDGESKGPLGPVPPPGAGACCFSNGFCMDDVTEMECAAEGGIFQGENTPCMDVVCGGPKGACCFANGACGLLEEDTCLAAGGDFMGNGTLCFANECPQQTRPCCFSATGECTMELVPACLTQGGLPQQPGENCETVFCPVPPEACCFPEGTCAVIDRGACSKLGGLPQGIGTNCETSKCPQRIGACCLPTGVCQHAMQAQCLKLNGYYQGDFTDCEDGIECPLPKGACCLSDKTCKALLAPDCEAQGGVYQGDNEPCSPGLCTRGGACCLANGNCLELVEAACIGIPGASYQGDDSSCDEVNCEPPPPATGACCHDDESCTVGSAEDCAQAGGTYLGDDTSCDADPCGGPIKGACCFSSGLCGVVPQAACNDAGGLYQGDFTVCVAGLCQPESQGGGAAAAAVLGDVNRDGRVGIDDLVDILGTWGICGRKTPCPADLNDDGIVDVTDLKIVLRGIR